MILSHIVNQGIEIIKWAIIGIGAFVGVGTVLGFVGVIYILVKEERERRQKDGKREKDQNRR